MPTTAIPRSPRSPAVCCGGSLRMTGMTGPPKRPRMIRPGRRNGLPARWQQLDSPSPHQKVENLAAAVSLHFMYYNFGRPHQTLTKRRKGYPTTPAMAAGLADHVWTLEDIAALLG